MKVARRSPVGIGFTTLATTQRKKKKKIKKFRSERLFSLRPVKGGDPDPRLITPKYGHCFPRTP